MSIKNFFSKVTSIFYVMKQAALHDRILKYDKPIYYDKRVLIGPWVQNRAFDTKEHYPHSTTYGDCFGPKPIPENDSSLIWDLTLNAQENNIISKIGRFDFPNYFENFTSLYDLSYNHFPKCSKSPLIRKLKFRQEIHEPTDEYLQTFGNLTKHGLLDYKKTNWHCELQDPRLTYSSSYRDDYGAPGDETYKFKRWRLSYVDTEQEYLNNLHCVQAKLRQHNMPCRKNLTEEFLVEKCNPITWQCAKQPHNVNKR